MTGTDNMNYIRIERRVAVQTTFNRGEAETTLLRTLWAMDVGHSERPVTLGPQPCKAVLGPRRPMCDGRDDPDERPRRPM